VGVFAALAVFIGAIILLIMRRRRAKAKQGGVEERPNVAEAPEDEKKLPAELSSPVEKIELTGSSPTSPADDFVRDRKDPLMGRPAPRGPTELAGPPGTGAAELADTPRAHLALLAELEATEVQKQND
jgi:hypothetical protein